LFIIVIDRAIRPADDQPDLGVDWQDGKRLTDFNVADDIALIQIMIEENDNGE